MGRSENREQWHSRIGFIMAAAGSAIGLGNVWRFPYLVGMNGGAAFVIVYILLAITVGLTVMLCEFCIGRASQKGSAGAFRVLAKNPLWSIFGWLGLLIGGFIILSYYGVIAGWTIKYIISSFTGLMGEARLGNSKDFYDNFISNSNSVIFYQIIAMFAATAIVAGGICKGIERACKVLMPALFIILLVLILRAVTLPGAEAGLAFYLKPDFSKLTGKTILDALGQGFFSLSLGMGIMITYGSYIDKDEKLPSSVGMIFCLDTFAALLAGLAIFPAVFAMGVEPSEGIGLTFVTLPGVFAKMPAGFIFSFLFFLLLFFAAITSMISLLEVAVTFFIDEFQLTRPIAACLAGAIVTILGIPSAYSLAGPDASVFGRNIFINRNFFDFIDYISNNILMPATAIGICVFVGWVWAESARKEITNNGLTPFPPVDLWLWSARLVAPIAIGLILYSGI